MNNRAVVKVDERIREFTASIESFFMGRTVEVGIYFTGSFGRNEVRYSQEGNINSDLDLLVVARRRDIKSVRRLLQEFIENVTEPQVDFAFILCLADRFEKQSGSCYQLSTNIDAPIYSNINIKFTCPGDVSTINYQTQPAVYYHAKYLKNKQHINLQKSILEFSKCLVRLNGLVNSTAYIYNKDLLAHHILLSQHIDMNIVSEMIEAIAENNESKDLSRDESLLFHLAMTVSNQMKAKKIQLSLKSAKTFYKNIGHHSQVDVDDYFAKMQNLVFLENQGLPKEKALFLPK